MPEESPTSAVEPRSRWLRIAPGLFVLALFARLLHLWQIRDAPFFELLLGDSQSYDAWARGLAAGNWLGDEVFYQAPLYPYFLGVIYAVAGRSFLLVRLLQALIGAISCVLLADAGRRWFSTRVGLVTGVWAAIYPPALFYDARLDKSVLDLLFVCLTLWVTSRLTTEPRGWIWWGAGATLGGLALTRENALVLFVGFAVAVAYRYRSQRAVLFRSLLLLGLGMATLLGPVALRNRVVGGTWHLTTSQLGPNLYIGNNPRSNGTYQPLRAGRGTWKFERTDATELAEAAEGRPLSPGEVSRFWTRRTLAYVASDPGDWVARKWVTFRLMWNGVEIGDSEDPYSHAVYSAPLRLLSPLLHFGILAPLALLGAWLVRGRWRELLPLYLMTAAYAASIVAFYVLGRYRYPLVPFLLLFAGAGVVALFERIPATNRATVAGWGVALVLLAAFCNWPLLEPESMRSVTEVNVAGALGERGDLEGAVRHLERAVTLAPDFELGHYNLANRLRALGNVGAAIEHYRRAVELRPDYFEALNNWGSLLLDERRLGEAAALFRRVLELEPASVPARYNLAGVLRLQGDLPGAIEQYREVLRLRPDELRARVGLEETLRLQAAEPTAP